MKVVLAASVRGLKKAGLTKSYNPKVVDYHLDPSFSPFVHLVSLLEVVLPCIAERVGKRTRFLP